MCNLTTACNLCYVSLYKLMLMLNCYLDNDSQMGLKMIIYVLSFVTYL